MTTPDMFALLEKRVAELELWRVEMQARYDEQKLHIDSRFDALDKKITEIGSDLKWASRTFIGAIILAVAAFVIKGGLNLG